MKGSPLADLELLDVEWPVEWVIREDGRIRGSSTMKEGPLTLMVGLGVLSNSGVCGGRRSFGGGEGSAE